MTYLKTILLFAWLIMVIMAGGCVYLLAYQIINFN